MLDKIQGNQADIVGQSASLDRIKEIDIKNHYSSNDSAYFIDESEISDTAYEKYMREQDVKRFSQILLETDEDEADSTEPYDPFSDIDESELESYIDDSEELFNENNQVKPSTINTASAQTQKRSQPKKLSRQEKLTSENVFLDGTERGTKSQKMFNHFSKVAQFASYFVGKEIGAWEK